MGIHRRAVIVRNRVMSGPPSSLASLPLLGSIDTYPAGTEGEGRYNPAEVASVEEVPVMGRPDP